MDEFEIYGGFANVYDEFMDNIPYDQWHVYLKNLLEQCGVNEGIVTELGCGTGTMTSMLANDGYDMIGIDISEEMLEIARDKCPENVLLLHQDMRELELYGSAAAFVCVCDGMNYILQNDELALVFENVYRYLDDGGVFIFDMKTKHFYRDVLGNQTIADNRENASFIWENEYDEENSINEYLLTIYQLVDCDRDLFERCDEYHRQRAYDIDEVKDMLTDAGFTCQHIYNAFTGDESGDDSERVYFVARK